MLEVEAQRALAPGEEEPLQLMDLGSGGGFPGLVLKLALPRVKVTLVEGTLKKARFLAQACQQLDLRGIQVLWGRAEVLAKRDSPQFRRDLRHAFHWVTAKGLGPVRQSLDLAAPFLRPRGVHWTFKGQAYDEELARCRRRMAQLRFRVYQVEAIPGDQASFVVGLQRQAAPVSRETPDATGA
jgi:16S rRNA (guanine527-N7)-methyltransferase